MSDLLDAVDVPMDEDLPYDDMDLFDDWEGVSEALESVQPNTAEQTAGNGNGSAEPNNHGSQVPAAQASMGPAVSQGAGESVTATDAELQKLEKLVQLLGPERAATVLAAQAAGASGPVVAKTARNWSLPSKIKYDSTDGRPDTIQGFVYNAEVWFGVNKIPDDMRVSIAFLNLDADAQRFWKSQLDSEQLNETQKTDWGEFKERLLTRFGRQDGDFAMLDKLLACKQGDGDVQSYVNRFEALAAPLALSDSDRTQKWLFTKGLSSDVRVASQHDPATRKTWESFLHFKEKAVAVGNALPRRGAKSAVLASAVSPGQRHKRSGNKFGARGGVEKPKRRPKTPWGKQKELLAAQNRCFHCKEEGHKSFDCPQKRDSSSAAKQPSSFAKA